MKLLYIVCASGLLATSCGEKTLLPETASLKMNLTTDVAGAPLIFDNIQFQNAAGNNYSVNRLQYYISGFSLFKNYGSNHTSTAVHYFDWEDDATHVFSIDDIPPGEYDGVSFYVGLDATANTSGSLPQTITNNNMSWPEPMGGGYHFLKLEGHYTDGIDTSGYSVHLGTAAGLVTVNIDYPMTLIYKNEAVELNMDVNKWFASPNVFDFDADGNYTMGNMPLMMKIAANGSNVFNMGP